MNPSSSTHNAPQGRCEPSQGCSAPLLAITMSSLLVVACGGGADSDPALPAPPAFVARAAMPSSSLSEFEKHDLNAGVMALDSSGAIKPRGCFQPYLSRPTPLADTSVRPAVRLFDNLSFMGTVSVGQLAYQTNTGFVLFDAMNRASDVTGITLPALQQVGLDIQSLRRIVITHGHGDHDGGVPYLQSTYGTPASIGAVDYTSSKTYVADLLDTSSLAPFALNLDGVSITAMWTPGHTPGTYSFILPVTQKGVAHKAAYFGGGAHPSNPAALTQYMLSAEAMYDLVLQTGADISVGSHPFFDGSDVRMDEVDAIGGYDKQPNNPMIQGTDAVALSFAILRECTAALLGRADQTAKSATWLPTQTEFYAAVKRGSGTVSVAARVSNAYKVVQGGKVTFSATDGTASCEATTDAAGVASCDLPNVGAARSLKASFQRLSSTSEVNLASSASVELN